MCSDFYLVTLICEAQSSELLHPEVGTMNSHSPAWKIYKPDFHLDYVMPDTILKRRFLQLQVSQVHSIESRLKYAAFWGC